MYDKIVDLVWSTADQSTQSRSEITPRSNGADYGFKTSLEEKCTDRTDSRWRIHMIQDCAGTFFEPQESGE